MNFPGSLFAEGRKKPEPVDRNARGCEPALIQEQFL
jgi:hypothetical protein